MIVNHGWIVPEEKKPRVVVRMDGRQHVMSLLQRYPGGDLLAHNGLTVYYVPSGHWRPFFEKGHKK
jgi:hypothetical protein